MRVQADIAGELIAILGEEGVAVDEGDRELFASDARGAGAAAAGERALPVAVARPASTGEVAAVVRLAASRRVALVPYGGGSGLMGGAASTTPGIVVDLVRMNRVREVDVTAQTVTVEAGAVLSDVNAALAPQGLTLGHDPWTVGVATVGGAISTNGLGFLGGRYGSMGDQVLGLEVVLASGEALRTRAVRPRSAGIDLSRLFVAAEGTLGVITAATLRAAPVPEAHVRSGFRFETFERGFEAIVAMQSVGLTPAMLDYGERPGGSRWGGEPPTLYAGFLGFREEVDACMVRARAICRQHGGESLSAEQVEEFWRDRHVPAERFAQRRQERRAASPPNIDRGEAFDYVHVSLPASRVLEYRKRALRVAREHEVEVMETGLWAAPGLFSMVLLAAGGRDRPPAARVADAIDALLREAHAAGGSMEYCHGAGLRLAHLIQEEHGDTGLAAMRAIKQALDPLGIMNPGKLGV